MGVRRRILQAGTAAVVVAMAVTACGSSGTNATSSDQGSTTSSSSATKAPLKIGVPGTFSGFAGVTSKADADAVQAWAKYTNAHGGINGHPVEVIVKDDAASASRSLVNVKELIEQDHVVALVGVWESGLEGSWASYAASKHVPVIGGGATGAQWMTDPNFFATAITAVNGLELTANTTKLAGNKSYGVVYCAEVPACAQGGTLSKSLAPKIGVTFAGAAALSASAPDYAAQCLTLQKAGADTIFLATAQETAGRFMQNCASHGYTFTPVEQSGTWTSDLAKKDAYQKLWIMSPGFSWLADTPAVNEFNAAMKQYSPDTDINGAATSGWAAGVVFGKAAAHVSDTPTSQEIYDGLYSLGADYTADGLMPPITYTKGKPAEQKPCAWYMHVQDGALVSYDDGKMVCI
ncbi:MAG TPA: ABC transporter substrate-binding protein, partial [Mycobacteriales bacterium]|nr:ABC transporter substrate-binding protein [Mycobacteriales bacterium]